MQIVRVPALGPAIPSPRGGVATLGVFDGVHLGHQALLRRVVADARERRVPSIVLTFAVHPVVVLKGLPPRLVTSLPHRLRLFESLGAEVAIVLPFDDAVRRLDAGTFARAVFVDGLGLSGLVLGPDARVGVDRRGDIDFLRGFCAAHSIRIEVIEPLCLEGERVSSTRIRAAIADGDLERASRMLGRRWSMFGTVVKGEGRGRKLGYPTANFDLHHEIRPPSGVYAVTSSICGREVGGVMNIGIRPTFGPDGDLTVEVNYFDFSGDLYGQDLEVVLVRRLRDEMRFASREELVRQIERDVDQARKALVSP